MGWKARSISARAAVRRTRKRNQQATIEGDSMPKRSGKRRLFARAYAHVFNEPWVVQESKLCEIAELLTLRRAGEEYTDAEIAERCGVSRRALINAALIDVDEEESESKAPYMTTKDGIAVLEIAGTLFPRANALERISGATSTTMMHDNFRAAMADPNVRAILLAIDSPGGAVTGVPEFADTIQAARSAKPVYACAVGTMASGAYWIGSAAEKVYASASAIVGSIGVYMAHADMSKAEEKRGVKTTLIAAGRHKIDGNPYEPLSEQSRTTFTERVNAIYDQFVGAIAKQRNMDAAALRSGPAQGKTYLADQSVREGLTDGVATLDQALALLRARISTTATAAGIPAAPSRGFLASDVIPPSAADSDHPPSSLFGVAPVNEKLKAALFARGLVAANATDEHAQIALSAFFAARGVAQPSDDRATIAALFDITGENASGVISQQANALNETERARINREATAAEQSRIDQLTARAELLGVTSADLQAAISGNLSLAAACEQWTAKLAGDRQPLTRRENEIRGGTSQLETLTQAGADLLIERISGSVNGTLNLVDKDGKPRAAHPAVNGMRYMTFFELAHKIVESRGISTVGMVREDIAKAFLAMAPRDAANVSTLAGFGGGAQASGASYNTPGMFPNLLASVAQKVLEGYIAPDVVTYKNWAKQLPSVPDFNPRTINRYALGGDLPRLVDNDKFPQSTLTEEANYIVTEEYGEKFGITPRMIANDDLSVFTDFLPAQMIKLERTLNRLCIEVLTGNPTMPDSVAFLATARGNLIQQNDVSFTVANVNTMNTAVRRFTNVDGSDVLGLRPTTILVPPELETSAMQFFMPFNVVPTQDSTVNPFRGKFKIEVDSMLTNTADWYAFVEKMLIAAIVYMHQQGYENGKRTSWYDPDFRTQFFAIEARMGVAANNWRGVAKMEDNND
jgi:signal peptide peptidase SppA